MKAIGNVAKTCVVAALAAFMLVGCGLLGGGGEPDSGVSEDKTTKSDRDISEDSTTKPVDSASNETGTEDVTSPNRNANSESGAATSQKKGETSIMSQDMGISAYVLKVGYLSEMDDVDGTIVVGSRKEWEDVLRFGEGMTFDEDGTTSSVISTAIGFKDYDQAFFDAGNKLLVAYQYLSTGAAMPTLTSLDLGQDGNLVLGWNDGLDPTMMVTDDMSGFLAIAEIPAGMNVTELQLESDS